MSDTLSADFIAADLFARASSSEGAHYSIFRVVPGRGAEALLASFPKGIANEMNFVLFSTSGVHGTYRTIEDAVEQIDNPDPDESCEVTFVIVQPRLCCLRYGNVEVTKNNAEWLKNLRASSHEIVAQIGMP